MRLETPLYLSVYNSLRQRIECQGFKVGDFLPSEPKLQKTFHVSRTTVRKAVEKLTHDGLVFVLKGTGIRVSASMETRKQGYITSFLAGSARKRN